MHLTAKDGRGQVLDPGDSRGQTGDNAHDPIKEGGVGGHGQDGGLAATDLGALYHHTEAHAEEVCPPQGGHHSPTHEPETGHTIVHFKVRIMNDSFNIYSVVVIGCSPYS